MAEDMRETTSENPTTTDTTPVTGTPVLVVTSRVKEYIASKELRCGAAFLEEFNRAVFQLLKAATERCVGNDRKTVTLHDV